MNNLQLVEIAAIITSLLYLFLLIKQNIWCWLFGIVSSMLSIYLFWQAQTYSEAFLYFFYTLAGGYGWLKWAGVAGFRQAKRLQKLPGLYHLGLIVMGLLLAFGVGWVVKHYLNGSKAYIDACTTSFSLIATYLEANKFVHAWVYWIAINAVTVWLYYNVGYTNYAYLMVLYFVLSFVGWYQWQRDWQQQYST